MIVVCSGHGRRDRQHTPPMDDKHHPSGGGQLRFVVVE